MSLAVSDLHKTYNSRGSSVRALRGVSLGVELGEVVALVGNNGAGKSTLMSIVSGLVSADSGSAVVMGHETTAGGGSPTHHLGLAPQEEAVYPTLTARTNLAYFATLAGLRGAAVDDRIDEVARELLLGDLLDRKAVELSGGQRRRLHTGLALMHSPEVLLLDEPTVGVDIDARLQLLQFVRDMAAGGSAVLYSTHQMVEVEQVASRAVVLHEGRVLAEGTVGDLVERHAGSSAELRFAATGGAVNDLFPGAVRSSRTVEGSHTILEVRLDSDEVVIADIVDALPESLRETLVSAEVHQPSFEQAYVNLVRSAAGGTAAATAATVPTDTRAT